MSVINALYSSQRLRDRLVDYALYDYYLSDPKLHKAIGELWRGSAAEGGLSNELWIEGAFPPRTQPKTLPELASAGLIESKLVDQLNQTGAFKNNTKPYLHQLESIQAAREGYKSENKPSIVISAGTGAGKTECFLIPLIDDIYRNRPQTGQGAAAIILYPMNALVTDQVDRLMKWLANQNSVTAFHFTSETPEDGKTAAERNSTYSGEWTFRSRQHARGFEDCRGNALKLRSDKQPDIIVTNYSMLEYMLCRPQDSCFFGKNLRTIVLDEAHLYTGNLAAEIALLIRRVSERSGKKSTEILTFATSATIQDKNVEATKEFAAKLFSKNPESTKLIIGKKEPLVEMPKPILSNIDLCSFGENSMPKEIRALTENNNGKTFYTLSKTEGDWLIDDLKKVGLCPNSDPHTATLLYNNILYSETFQNIIRELYLRERMPLNELVNKVKRNSKQPETLAIQKLLTYGAMARRAADDHPLLPNRIHFMLRAPDGISVSFKRNVSDGNNFTLQMGTPYREESKNTLWLTLGRKHSTGVAYIVALNRQINGRSFLQELSAGARRGHFDDDKQFLVYKADSSLNSAGADTWVNPTTGEIHSKQSDGLVPLITATGVSASDLDYFSKPNTPYILAVGSSLLTEMPNFPNDNREWKPAQGRRLLVFSDSRKEAARLGTHLASEHEKRLIMRCVAEVFSVEKQNEDEIRRLEEELQQASITLKPLIEKELLNLSGVLTANHILEKVLGNKLLNQLFDRSNGHSHNAKDWNQNEFERNLTCIKSTIGQRVADVLLRKPKWPAPSVETAGIYSVSYPNINKCLPTDEILIEIGKDSASKLNAIWPELVSSILDYMRSMGGVTLEGFSSANDRDADAVAHPGKWILKNADGEDYKISMCPNRADAELFKFSSRVIRMLNSHKILDNIEHPEIRLLEAVYESLLSAISDLPWLEQNNFETSSGIVKGLRIKLKDLLFEKPKKLYVSSISGQVVPRCIFSTYPGLDETETLEAISQDKLDRNPRLSRMRDMLLRSDVLEMGIWSEEHTGQLSPRENRRIQDLFKIGARNLLSSTTTLELGIDIGGLQGVMLSNIPPGKANYLQRAGRAGRSSDGSSIVLTFCRGTAYEREMFLDFGSFLNSELRKPTVLLERTQIVKRHLYAYIINEFFRKESNLNSGAMSAYDRFGRFCGVSEIPQVQSGRISTDNVLNSNQTGIAQRLFSWLKNGEANSSYSVLMDLAKGSPEIIDELKNDGVSRFLSTLLTKLKEAVNIWVADYEKLSDEWIRLVEIHNKGKHQTKKLNTIFYQAKMLFSSTTIQVLSEAGILPRYGFPIGLNSLKVLGNSEYSSYNTGNSEDSTRLERSSIQALGEYVPGSVVLVGGRYIESSGILLHWTGKIRSKADDHGLGNFYNYTINDNGVINKTLMTTTGNNAEQVLLIPRHGYSTSAHKIPSFNGKTKTVKGIKILLGDLPPETIQRNMFGGLKHITCALHLDTEIFAVSRGENGKGYAICYGCGYAESEKKLLKTQDKSEGLSRKFINHTALSKEKESLCMSNEIPTVLRNISLGAGQKTHACVFTLDSSFSNYGENAFNALAHTLTRAAAKLLEIDQREISALECYGDPRIVIYETAAGGAGHLLELMDAERQKQWLAEARKLLRCDDQTKPEARILNIRILSSQSPTDKTTGELKFDALSARDILNGVGLIKNDNDSIPIPSRLKRK